MHWPFPITNPPIARLKTGDGESQLRSAICLSNDDPIPRRLALALRIPDAGDPEFQSDMARIHREVDLLSRLVDRDREVVELRVESNDLEGRLRIEAIHDVSEALRHQFHFCASPDSEYAIVVHPRAIRPKHIESLVSGGYNRLVFSAIPQEPSIVRIARTSGIRSICIASVEETRAIECAERMRPDRLTVRGSAGTSSTRHCWPDDPGNVLQLPGYLDVGLGHYVLPGDDLATAFMGYKLEYRQGGFTAHAECDAIGFGPGAVSRVGGYLGQNSESCAAWRHEVDAGRLPAHHGLWLSLDDELRAELMQQLLCRRQIDIPELEQKYAIDFRSYFAAELGRLAPCLRQDVVRDFGNRIAVCSRGWPCLHKIAQCFAADAGDDHWLREISLGS